MFMKKRKLKCSVEVAGALPRTLKVGGATVRSTPAVPTPMPTNFFQGASPMQCPREDGVPLSELPAHYAWELLLPVINVSSATGSRAYWYASGLSVVFRGLASRPGRLGGHS